MHRAGNSGIEGMYGAQNLKRFFHDGHRYIFQGFFHRSGLALVVAGAEVPGGRHHHLVIADLLVLDVDPVAYGTAGCFVQPHAGTAGGSGGRLIGTATDGEFIEPPPHSIGDDLSFQCPGGRAAEHGEQGGFAKADVEKKTVDGALCFGHVAAVGYQHACQFEVADGGDIFLDEIGDIPLSTQAKLLRVLETKEFTHIGGERPICVDVRFITATNQDLAKRVSEGRFRQDLFFRINVFPIAVPPLRERKEDIALLVNSFVHDLRETSGKRISGVTPEVMDLLMRYEWPGNVRELKSTLEYGVAIAGSGVIGIEHLPAQFRPLIESRQKNSPTPEAVPEPSDPLEKLELIAALRKANGNQTHAAKALSVHRMTVLNRMRKYGIRLHEILQ